MIDNIIICRKLRTMSGYYSELKKITDSLELDTYISNILIRRAVEREIQLIVECATDINNMILRKLKMGPAKDYFNSFIDLAENDVIKMEFALKIAPSTGLRNILIHEYQKIDDVIVFRSIKDVLSYYNQYLEIITKYLDCNQVQ
jgi:uncharacterized protein YutE (UPF0331/DUF86 family)